MPNLLPTVEAAYHKLKQEVYHDTINLFLRHSLAEFEADGAFEEKLSEVAHCLRNRGTQAFERWRNEISFHLLPKGVSTDLDKARNDKSGGVFITNKRTADSYALNAVEYFIDAPVELHILSVVWCMRCGPLLERKFVPGVYANRLDKDAASLRAPDLFRLFHRQYAKWRDGAIEEAKIILAKDRDVALVALDVKRFFYNIQLDWDGLLSEIRAASPRGRKRLNVWLTRKLRDIHVKYWEACRDWLLATHDIGEKSDLLPIGLLSSGVLSNWALCDFDSMVREEVRPAFYGRYCDDILIVLPEPSPSFAIWAISRCAATTGFLVALQNRRIFHRY